MTVYVENSKELTKILLKKISDYRKVAENNVSIQKSIAFLHANKEQMECELKTTIPFTLVPSKMKYLDINL